MIEAGLDVARLNFSHGNADEHRERVRLLRAAAAECGRDIGIMGDLQGPKIRVTRFRDHLADLVEGAPFFLDSTLGYEDGSVEGVGVALDTLHEDVKPGDVLLLNDGMIELKVERIQGTRIHTIVRTGGTLSDHKGINKLGGGLSAAALTPIDRENIRLAAELEMDFLAVSFVRTGEDVALARRLFEEAGGKGQIVAKIERAEAVENFDAILEASDVIMVARGDLGVEIGDAELPAVQKRLIHLARELNSVVITATQMMQSMIEHPIPTRAEVFDVANAVLDGTDAVMLSAETAVGRYPVKVVREMSQVIVGAEKWHMTYRRDRTRLDGHFTRTDEAIAAAVMYTANHLDVKAIVALTESGSTPLWMSRIRTDIPIYAFTRQERTRRRVTLYRGVYPIAFDVTHTDREALYHEIFDLLLENDIASDGDLVILTTGELSGVTGGTNAMKILRVARRA